MATRSTPYAVPVRAFRAEDLQALLAPSERPCVSIYLPTHRRDPERRQDPTRYRALVGQVESRLAAGSASRDTKRLLEPLHALGQDPHWEHPLDGLAVFVSPALSAAFRMPLSVPERAVVADTFHVKPLIRFLHANRRYFALALSQNAVSLYEGSSFGAGTVELRGLPKNFRDALGVPDFDRVFSGHGGLPGMVFHGRGPGKEETKETLLKYFRTVDRGLREYLRDERAPLVLAAVKYYHPMYRGVNTYPHLLPEGLEGNYERVNGDQIHEAAWPIVSGAFGRQVGEWVQRYRSMVGTGLASDRLEEIAPAAIGGRVRCMLAAEGETVWGMLDRATGAVTYHERQKGTEDDDLLDDLCEESLKRGAEVYVIPRASMPTESPIAAVYRF